MIIELFVGSLLLLVAAIVIGVRHDRKLDRKLKELRKEQDGVWEEEYKRWI